MTIKLLSSLSLLPYFTSKTVTQLTGKSVLATRQYLTRHAHEGELIRLKRDTYMTREFMLRAASKSGFLEMISAIIEPSSYVSREFVLQRHGVLTEVTYPVTLLTIKNTKRVINQFGTFLYAHIKPSEYSGFSQSELFGIPYFVASKEKALFDFFYLRSISASDIKQLSIAEELRLNLSDWSSDDVKEFFTYIRQSNSPKMRAIANNLRKDVWQPFSKI